jgi:hypothetical protein
MVERYGFTIYNDASGGMEPDVNGDYVRHDDYRELVSKLDAITRRAEAAEGDWQHMEEQYQSARKQLDSVTGNLQEAQSRLGRLIGPNEIANAAEARKVGMKRVVMSVPVDLIEEIGGVVERQNTIGPFVDNPDPGEPMWMAGGDLPTCDAHTYYGEPPCPDCKAP